MADSDKCIVVVLIGDMDRVSRIWYFGACADL